MSQAERPVARSVVAAIPAAVSASPARVEQNRVT